MLRYVVIMLAVSSQWIRLQLCVLRSPRRKLALIQKKFAGAHCTQVGLTQRGEPFLQCRKSGIRAVSTTPSWRAGFRAASRQGQVRAERSVLPRNIQPTKCRVNAGCQFGEFGASRNSEPKHARGLGGRKETVATN